MHNTLNFMILHSLTACFKVLELAAEDRDTGENAQLTFSVVAGDQEQKFYMVSLKQEQRGILKLKKRLDYERHSEQRFNLTLKVHEVILIQPVCFLFCEVSKFSLRINSLNFGMHYKHCNPAHHCFV